MHRKTLVMGYGAAVGSAAFVGLFTVLNKWLLSEDVPSLTAGAWTYFAAGMALLPWAIRAGGVKFRKPKIAALWLLAGSLIGPSLYFVGLKLTSGVQGVLMINMEAVFTALLAFVVFKERLTRQAVWASLTIVAGGLLLSWPEHGASLLTGGALGNLLIAAGYLGWATENNLGRLLGEDIPPISLVCIKALMAGLCMGVLALLFGQPLGVGIRVIPGILASGALSLGLSLALFYSAMQYIGAGRAGLISSTSAFWGIVAALLLLGETITSRVAWGGLLMLVGMAGFAYDSIGAEGSTVKLEEVGMDG